VGLPAAKLISFYQVTIGYITMYFGHNISSL